MTSTSSHVEASQLESKADGRRSPDTVASTSVIDMATLYDRDAPEMEFNPISSVHPEGSEAPRVQHFDGVPGALLIRGFLSRDEVASLREGTDAMGFGPSGFAKAMSTSGRLVLKGVPAAKALWSRVEPLLRAQGLASISEEDSVHRLGYDACGAWDAVGLNETLRFNRYGAGGHLGPHNDASYKRGDEERSAVTFLVYLNDVEEAHGGSTNFIRDCELSKDGEGEDALYRARDEDILHRVQPEAGTLLMFPQRTCLHEGGLLTAGVKYILRSDVMFARRETSRPERSPEQAEALALVERAGVLEADGDYDGAVAAYRRAFRLWPDVEDVLRGSS